MSFLSRLFGSGKGPSPRKGPEKLEDYLQNLERKAEGASLGAKGTYFNRAGDACLKAGDHPKALIYFGKAIDTLLEDEQPESARGVAKKIIRVHPEAVRTLCTLTWLDLAAQRPTSAGKSLQAYKAAVQRIGKEGLAEGQILAMARVTADSEFLDVAASVLEEIGFPTGAKQVRGWATAGGCADSHGEPEALSRYCLSAAVGSNELRRAEKASA